MNLIFHQFKKDFLRFRYLLIPWFISSFLQLIFLGHFFVHDTDNSNIDLLNVAAPSVFAVIEYLLLFMLVTFLVQEESILRKDAFWKTRPVTPVMLILSKSTFIVLLFLFPLMATQGLAFFLNDLGITNTWLAMAETFLKMFSAILGFACLASMTSNFSRCSLLLAGLSILFIIILTLCFKFLPFPPFTKPEAFMGIFFPDSFLSGRNVILCISVTLFFLSASILNQYLTRKTIFSFFLIFLAYGVPFLMKASMAQKHLNEVKPEFTSPEFMALHLNRESIHYAAPYEQSSFSGTTYSPASLLGDIDVTGLPWDTFCNLSLQKVQMMSDGQVLWSESPQDELHQRGNYFDRIIQSEISKYLGDYHFMNLPPKPFRRFTKLLEATPHLKSKISNISVDYSADFEAEFYQYKIIAEIPAVQGQFYQNQFERISVQKIQMERLGIKILLDQSIWQLLFKLPEPGFERWRDMSTTSHYVLINKINKEALLASNPYFDPAKFLTTFSQRLLYIQSQTLLFNHDSPGHPLNLDPAWLQHAFLLKISRIPAGNFEQKLSVKDFKLISENPNQD